VGQTGKGDGPGADGDGGREAHGVVREAQVCNGGGGAGGPLATVIVAGAGRSAEKGGRG